MSRVSIFHVKDIRIEKRKAWKFCDKNLDRTMSNWSTKLINQITIEFLLRRNNGIREIQLATTTTNDICNIVTVNETLAFFYSFRIENIYSAASNRICFDSHAKFKRKKIQRIEGKYARDPYQNQHTQKHRFHHDFDICVLNKNFCFEPRRECCSMESLREIEKEFRAIFGRFVFLPDDFFALQR